MIESINLNATERARLQAQAAAGTNTPEHKHPAVLRLNHQRVVYELAELDIRINALSRFRATELHTTLDVDDQMLLYTQQAYMTGYAEMLGKRIERFKHGA